LGNLLVDSLLSLSFFFSALALTSIDIGFNDIQPQMVDGYVEIVKPALSHSPTKIKVQEGRSLSNIG